MLLSSVTRHLMFRRLRWSSVFVSILIGLCIYVGQVDAAWQEIADWVDCGSSNFQTQRILVDYNTETYWLNMSIVGTFNREVVDSEPETNKAGMCPIISYICRADFYF